jgi:hypothetical protein
MGNITKAGWAKKMDTLQRGLNFIVLIPVAYDIA